MLFNTLVPDTKQMAAIYVLPKIANSSIVSKDIPDCAKELIFLAKDYVRGIAAEKAEALAEDKKKNKEEEEEEESSASLPPLPSK